ncbi:MAG: MASE1 domain-containing protein [Planctomycetes bacterium]|nr:MASE1 domain-containing protein [Planctomycetota bacterium]
MRPTRTALENLAFGAALLLSFQLREGDSPAVAQAVVWLPTGVAIAGIWRLGYRSAWIVAVATVVQRLMLGYPPGVVMSAAIGSTAEGLFGVFLLRRLGLRSDLARLRDAAALFTAAAAAPLASILASWFARVMLGVWRELPFYSGWDGWWRMNALGALCVVPVALLWFEGPAVPAERRRSTAGELTAEVLLMLGLLWAGLFWLPAVPSTLLALHLALPVAFLATLRSGPRGAATVASAGALLVAAIATHGNGPFQCVPLEDRHTAIQLFLLTLVAVPLVAASLLAERDDQRAHLLRSEAVRDALLRLLPDTACRFDRHGNLVDVHNPSGDSLWPATVSARGLSLEALLPSELVQRFRAALQRARIEPTPAAIEYDFETATGTQHREARFTELGNGEVLCAIRDITTYRQAQRLLHWQADILERIAAGQPNATLFPVLLHGFEAFLDHGIGSLLLRQGDRLYPACAPNLPAELVAATHGFPIGPNRGSCGTAAHENRTTIAVDLRSDPRWHGFRHLALDHGLQSCWSVPVRTANGDVCGTLAIYHRVPRAPTGIELATVERAATLAGIAIERERREELLAAIHRNVGEGLYRSQPGRGLVYANAALARLFGYESPELLLQAATTAATAAAADAPLSLHQSDLARFAVAMPQMGPTELRLHRADGTEFWGLLSCSTVRSSDGSTSACDGALADVTHQKQLAEQLRQAQKMEAVGKLAGGIAHDFNNLLTAIAGYAEAVRERIPASAEVRADLDEIVHATDRAASLTRQLLAFGRRQVLQPKVLDLSAVVASLANLLRRLIGETIELRVEATTAGLFVRADQHQIEQVLLNLALNARDAMPNGGALTIGLADAVVPAAREPHGNGLRPGQYAVITVRDDGVGMTEDVRARAFDPFFTTKSTGQGTGLGLATVYGIVQQSGGAVWLDSAPGRGTTVVIHLPRVMEAPEPEPAPQPSAGRLRPMRILVAEDELLVRELVQRILTRAGHEVVAVDCGAAALAVVQDLRQQFDVLLTDAVMPGIGGHELTNRIHVLRPNLPVVLMSGYAHDGHHLRAAGEPARFLQKPFHANQLLEAVERAAPSEPSPRGAATARHAPTA